LLLVFSPGPGSSFLDLLSGLGCAGSGRNELVNSATAGFSLYYGLLLGLLSVAAYQSSKEVEDAVSREASTLAALYCSCEVYPEPLRGDLLSAPD
jgi:hypothetical protein